MTANQQDEDVPIDTSLQQFGQTFGLRAPPSHSMVPIKRLGMNGATNGRYFEFPPLTAGQSDSVFCEQAFTQRVLAKIEACVGVGIYSLRLTYHDGSQSPLFGHRQPNVENVIAADESGSQMPTHIAAASVQAWAENYVQVLSLLGNGGNEDVIAHITS